MTEEELKFVLKGWVAVTGYDGLYEVHASGAVRSVGFATPAGYRKGRVLKPTLSSGYPAVCLVRNGKKKTVRVHQLVCAKFHGAAPSLDHEVAHNDGVKTNCCAANLRWATRKENNHDKVVHGTSLRGDKHHQTKIPDALVPIIQSEYAKGSSEFGLKALAKKYGCSTQPIFSIVSGERLTSEVSS